MEILIYIMLTYTSINRDRNSYMKPSIIIKQDSSLILKDSGSFITEKNYKNYLYLLKKCNSTQVINDSLWNSHLKND